LSETPVTAGGVLVQMISLQRGYPCDRAHNPGFRCAAAADLADGEYMGAFDGAALDDAPAGIGAGQQAPMSSE
jgi:hypothetical protein